MVKKCASRLYMFLIFLFLYLPIIVLIALSFNNSKTKVVWGGFTFHWYASCFQDEKIMSAFITTLQITFLSAIISTLIGTLAALGIADFVYQKHKFNEDMKMTKQEVKDEFKNTEGDPQIKGRQRRKMQEVSQKRMMQDVPKADVVITNPTHFAVALRYDTKESTAPVVVAKGADYVAQKIKEIAKDNKIEIVENKPLARMIYHNVDLGAEIPPELYQGVAEVLACVYRLKNPEG